MQGGKGQKILILGAIAAATVLFARYLLPIVFPFLLGAGLAWGAEPAVRVLQRRVHLPRWAASGAGVTGFFVLMLCLIILLISLLVRQLGRLSGLLPQMADTVGAGLTSLEGWLLQLTRQLPQSVAPMLERSVEKLFSDSSALLDQAASRVPQLATGLMGTLGHWGLTLFTAIFSGYMISARLPKLRLWCREKLPQVWQEQYLPGLKAMRSAIGHWLLAQGKLMTLTFLLLSVGFFLLQIENVLLIAALVTLVDAFPVLGTGTVLIPWSIVCLLQGDNARGIGLLGVYAVVWLLRSVLEPRILGKELGIDPLLTLFSIYAGFCITGITGMLIAPIIAMLIVQLVKQRA